MKCGRKGIGLKAGGKRPKEKKAAPIDKTSFQSITWETIKHSARFQGHGQGTGHRRPVPAGRFPASEKLEARDDRFEDAAVFFEILNRTERGNGEEPVLFFPHKRYRAEKQREGGAASGPARQRPAAGIVPGVGKEIRSRARPEGAGKRAKPTMSKRAGSELFGCEGDDLVDGGCIGEEHHHPVDPDGDPGRLGHAGQVLEK